MVKYEYEVGVRVEKGELGKVKHGKVKHLNGKSTALIFKRKSKASGESLHQVIENLMMAETEGKLAEFSKRFQSNWFRNLKNMGVLENFLRLEEKLYSESNGVLGSSPKFISWMRKKAEQELEDNHTNLNNEVKKDG